MSNDEQLIKNLKKLQDDHEKQLSDIRAKIYTLDTVPKAKALVGKCFKYQNGSTFGHRQGWVYEEVIHAENDQVFVNKFITEVSKRLVVKVEFYFASYEYLSHFSHSALIPITKTAYDKEFNRVIKLIQKINEDEAK